MNTSLQFKDASPEVCSGIPSLQYRMSTPSRTTSTPSPLLWSDGEEGKHGDEWEDTNETNKANDSEHGEHDKVKTHIGGDVPKHHDLDTILCAETPDSQQVSKLSRSIHDETYESDTGDEYSSDESTLYSDEDEGDGDVAARSILSLIGNRLGSNYILISYPTIVHVDGNHIPNDGCICLQTDTMLAHIILKIRRADLLLKHIETSIEYLTAVNKDTLETVCFQRTIGGPDSCIPRYTRVVDAWRLRKLIDPVREIKFDAPSKFEADILTATLDARVPENSGKDAYIRYIYIYLVDLIRNLDKNILKSELAQSKLVDEMNGIRLFQMTGLTGESNLRKLVEGVDKMKVPVAPRPAKRPMVDSYDQEGEEDHTSSGSPKAKKRSI